MTHPRRTKRSQSPFVVQGWRSPTAFVELRQAVILWGGIPTEIADRRHAALRAAAHPEPGAQFPGRPHHGGPSASRRPMSTDSGRCKRRRARLRCLIRMSSDGRGGGSRMDRQLPI